MRLTQTLESRGFLSPQNELGTRLYGFASSLRTRLAQAGKSDKCHLCHFLGITPLHAHARANVCNPSSCHKCHFGRLCLAASTHFFLHPLANCLTLRARRAADARATSGLYIRPMHLSLSNCNAITIDCANSNVACLVHVAYIRERTRRFRARLLSIRSPAAYGSIRRHE